MNIVPAEDDTSSEHDSGLDVDLAIRFHPDAEPGAGRPTVLRGLE